MKTKHCVNLLLFPSIIDLLTLIFARLLSLNLSLLIPVGSDYQQIPDNVVTLSSTVTSLNVTIQLIDDDVYELTETLLASLSFNAVPQLDVTINPSGVEITIFDDDSE